ncbi:MAG: ABC transporter transmembrane domain-containing protein [Anaerolineae bacterium]
MKQSNFYQAALLLGRYLAPFKWRVALLSLLLLGSISLQLWAPQVVGTFLDQAQRGETSRVLLGTAVLFFLLTIGQKTISLYNTYLSEDLGWAATNRLRHDLAAHCLRLDLGFHKLRTPGELIERIDGDVSTLAESFSALVVQMFGNSLLVWQQPASDRCAGFNLSPVVVVRADRAGLRPAHVWHPTGHSAPDCQNQ